MTTARDEFDDLLVLRRSPYGESDWIVTALARRRGLLSARARGARRSKRRFQGGLGSFLHFSARLGRPRLGELWELAEVEIRRSYAALGASVGAMAHASYGTEIVRELLPAERPEPEIFDLVLELYESLAAIGPSPAALRSFELRLLGLLGLAPALTRCTSCERDLPVEQGEEVAFSPAEGGAVCAGCRPGLRSPAHLAPGARALLAAAGELPIRSAASDLGGADEESARSARGAMVALVLHHVGKSLRSLEFITKLRGGAERATKDG